MPRNSWYIDWFNSPFYYHLYANRNEKEAAGFAEHIIEYLKPPAGSRMLDLACGKGRYSKALAAMGFEVTGTDISTTAIAYSKKSETGNLQFYVHDMRLPFWINYFDYAFNFFTSFGYFRTKREHEDSIRTVSNSLKKGGTFVIDFLNVRFCEKRLVPEEIKCSDNTIYKIQRWDDDLHFYKKIEIEDSSLPKPIEFTEEVSKLTLDDFNDMLSKREMQIINVFGDYELNPYDIEKTPRMIVVAKK